MRDPAEISAGGLDLAYGLNIAAKKGGWHWTLQMPLATEWTAETLLERYANWRMGGGQRLSLEDFRDFWKREQIEPPELTSSRSSSVNIDVASVALEAKNAAEAMERSEEEATKLFFENVASSYETREGYSVHTEAEPMLKRRDFQRLLLDPLNSAIDPGQVNKVSMDMTQPLSHYLIHSSHNTYLIGNQLTSDSSADMYRRVLSMGCRCIELDCFDGPDNEPIIYHKMSRTTRITLRAVLEAINETAFPGPTAVAGGRQSEYPVILSLEMHCGLEQQAIMADMLNDIFGERLLKPLPPQLSRRATGSTLAPAPSTEAPHVCEDSPEALRGKIIVKGKKPVSKEDDDVRDSGGTSGRWADDGDRNSSDEDDDDGYEDNNGEKRSRSDLGSSASAENALSPSIKSADVRAASGSIVSIDKLREASGCSSMSIAEEEEHPDADGGDAADAAADGVGLLSSSNEQRPVSIESVLESRCYERPS